MQIILLGATGRLGKEIAAILTQKNRNVRTLNREQCKSVAHLKDLLNTPSLFLDVSLPEGTLHLSESLKALPAEAKTQVLGVIVGSTGHTQEQMAQIKELSQFCALCLAPNFSKGILLLHEMFGATATNGKKVYDVARDLGFNLGILEIHHQHKRDPHSGTSLALAKHLEIDLNQICSFRLGEAIGEHSVIMNQTGEELRVTHHSYERKIYARGAVDLCEKMSAVSPRPGIYSLKDFLLAP